MSKPRGECFKKCLAWLLAVKPEQLPSFRSAKQFAEANKWLQTHCNCVLLELELDEDSLSSLDGVYHIACGQSPTRGLNHAIVVCGSNQVYDPAATHDFGLRGSPVSWSRVVLVVKEPAHLDFNADSISS